MQRIVERERESPQRIETGRRFDFEYLILNNNEFYDLANLKSVCKFIVCARRENVHSRQVHCERLSLLLYGICTLLYARTHSPAH